MRSRTQGCTALLPTGNLTGSVKMWCLATNATAASPILLPRVTQILVVDLYYIKQMPFLLGELVPLGLALCTPAKNRTAAVIAAGIRSFISTAKSRDFDCVQLRTDGEGAVAAMAMELAGLGIVVDVAGSGQHVPVVERKILSYVMTRQLGAGVSVTAQPELAMLFLDKLDPQRYAGMLAHLTNDATLGRALPQTLHAAWSIASGWKSASTKIAGGSDMQSVFMLADDAIGPPRNPKAGRGAGRGARRRATQRDHKRSSTGVDTSSKPSGTSTMSETRTCRGCC